LSFDRGLGTLTSALASNLNGVVRATAAIERIEKADRGWRVHVAGGVPIDADHVVLALPSHVASRVTAGFDREFSAALSSIPYASISTVALAYRTDAIARPLEGYGYLVTRREDLSTLGVLWESSIFPHRAPEGFVLLRVMLGGARRPEVSAFDDQMVGELAAREAAQILGISGRPFRQWICRWPAAIAQYTVGHDRRIGAVRRLAAAHRGLHVCGTAFDGVSFNDAIAAGRNTGRAVALELAS
jgi:oxygen-dependent protoporphyrinogen oxidase